MADAVAELEGTLYQQLPALLQELQANHQNVAHIADWCGQTYVTPGEDKAATFERTQSYLKDALLTVAGHMTSAGASLTQTIDLQAVELESLDAMVRLIENRLAYQKEQLGRGAVSQQVRHRAFAPKTEAALEREPEQVRPVVDQLRDEKGRINFDALRDVGSTIPVGRGPSPSLGGGHAFPPPPPGGAYPPPPPGGPGMPPPPPGGPRPPPPPPDASWKPPPPPPDATYKPPPPPGGPPPPPGARPPPPPVGKQYSGRL